MYLTFLIFSLLNVSDAFIFRSVRSLRMSTNLGHTNETPNSNADKYNKSKSMIPKIARVAAAGAVIKPMVSKAATLEETIKINGIEVDKLPLGRDAYTALGNTVTCKLLNGMWQVSGAHGYTPETDSVVSEMSRAANSGFTTFDLADIYGPAEDYVGEFSKGIRASDLSKDCQFFTKWVPRPTPISRKATEDAIGRSLRRMKTDRLDLVQFHWWDYSSPYYFDAMDNLMSLQQNGQIRNIGLTNFDTEHMVGLMDQGAPIVSNQVAFSIIDTRPLQRMIPVCNERNVKLLCYATLMGGFISKRWLGKQEPDYNKIKNVSLRKYLPWIRAWGGWSLFQELLQVLDKIAMKHQVSLSNVAVRWVIEQPAVGGAIVGARLGLDGCEHVTDNSKVFTFALDNEDKAAIMAIQSRGKDLAEFFGDCGGEYRRA